MTRRLKVAIVSLAMAALAATDAGCGRAVRPAATAASTAAAAPGGGAPDAAGRSAASAPPAALSPPAPAQAAAPAPSETGGPVGAVRTYFEDLAGHRYDAAYALIAPAWRHAHTLALFRAGLPAGPTRLISARIRSAADFDATVDLTVRNASGRTLRVSASLVDLAQAPGAGGFSDWRLTRPVGAG